MKMTISEDIDEIAVVAKENSTESEEHVTNVIVTGVSSYCSDDRKAFMKELGQDYAFDEETQSLLDEGLNHLGFSANGTGLVFLNLSLCGRNLDNADFLSKFEHLQVINVSHNNLKDLSALKNIPYLISLNASHNQLEKIVDFTPPLRLKEMNVANNKIKEIGDLSCHPSLHTLLIDYNEIEEITGLSSCACLRNLSLSHNQITKITGLDNLPLKQLDLSHNELKKIENIQFLRKLQYINLAHNSLRSLRGLQDHPLLEDICLKNNEILDISEIRYLRNLGMLRILDLMNNPIQGTVDYRLSILFKLPMLVELDLIQASAEEKVAADNLFNPSINTVAARDHMYHIMKFYQSSQTLLDSTLSNGNAYPMLILTGPIGLGKMLLVQNICTEYETYFENCIVHTTRKLKRNLVQGVKNKEDSDTYHFITTEEFQTMKLEGKFLQTYTRHGHQYGISRTSIENIAKSGLACVLTMELQGVMSMKDTHYEPRFVLLLPKDKKVYKERLQESNRYTESHINESLRNVDQYINIHREKPGYFDATIVTDDFTERYDQLRTIVLNYLGITPPNTSLSLSLFSMSRKSRAVDSEKRNSSLRTPSCSSRCTENVWGYGETPAILSFERRFEDTKSALTGIISFEEQLSKVRTSLTPSSSQIVPFVDGYEYMQQQMVYKQEWSPEKILSEVLIAENVIESSSTLEESNPDEDFLIETPVV